MPVWTCGKCGTINSGPAKSMASDNSAICRACGERINVPRPDQTVSS